MKIVVDLGNGGGSRWLRRSRMLGMAIIPILEANIQINRLYLRANPQTPLLYKSGVRYKNEPKGQGYEDFALIPAVLSRGWGDCDDLAPWRAAELIERFGIPAKIRVQWKRTRGGQKLYHIQVRLPQPSRLGLRHDRTIEDPSRILGMQ